MWRQFIVTAVCAAAVFAVASCSGRDTNSESLTSTPSTTTNETSRQALPYGDAPKVQTPLPESIFSGDPCADSLTADQIMKTLGKPVDTKRADAETVGPGCDWRNTVTTGHAIMRYATKLPDGLSAIYENVKPNALKWEPLTVQGFPAVAYVSPSGGSPDKFCQVSIGATDNTTIEISGFLSLNSQGKKDPCDAAKSTADLVMTSLRAKAGV
ncbi:DUF3558 domain-containing protein [Amycolatopsis thailandensis]|uniref:DUF3558 domain-containing protein n=1 Tax=Amycolatopsis thailandensis TaxID=589330 RepID=UPI00364EE6C1